MRDNTRQRLLSGPGRVTAQGRFIPGGNRIFSKRVDVGNAERSLRIQKVSFGAGDNLTLWNF